MDDKICNQDCFCDGILKRVGVCSNWSKVQKSSKSEHIKPRLQFYVPVLVVVREGCGVIKESK